MNIQLWMIIFITIIKCATNDNYFERIATRNKRSFANSVTTTTTTESVDQVLITCVPRLLKCGDCPTIKYIPLLPECEQWDCSTLRTFYRRYDDSVYHRNTLDKLNITIAKRIDYVRYGLDRQSAVVSPYGGWMTQCKKNAYLPDEVL